jgi:hypothetical protein
MPRGMEARLMQAARRGALRLYSDYLQPERLHELRRLLEAAAAGGYQTMTLSAFADRHASGSQAPEDRILLLRHDIDSDVPRARRMWEIERSLGMVGSYFFRHSTWDLAFMRELAQAGCEVGYHYEELATLIKEHGAGAAHEARALLDPARARLRSTIAQLRADSGLALDVLASHGDFANRAVGVGNLEMLADDDLRAEIGVRLEAYDVDPHIGARSADGVPPRGWRPRDPLEAIACGERVVGVLLHPRAWGRSPLANAREDVHRLAEGSAYRLRCARRGRAMANRLDDTAPT